MGLAQLVGSRQTVLGSDGKPLQNGKLYVRELNSSLAITTYKESGLINPNTQPVRTDGAGKCRIWVSRDCDFRIETKDNVLVDEELSVNPADLSDPASSGLVPNGSFEIDEDSNDEPDGWTRTDEASSTNGLDDTKSTAGGQSMRFTSAGSGGGDIITDEFFPVVDTEDLRVDIDIECSVVDVRVIVRIEWFDISQVSISNSDVYDNASANPTTFATQNLLQTPPANARFAKLRLIGCDPSDATPGSTWFDNCKVFYPLIVSGVFDNITIQDNEIISTNTNGDIELTPHGTGEVVIAGPLEANNAGVVDLTDDIAAFKVGLGAAQHLEMDGNDIQSKSDATTAAALDLNRLGGNINVNDIVPHADSTHDLGTNGFRFQNAFLDNLDVGTDIVVGGTVDGRDIDADGTVLDGIEPGADITDTGNVTSAGALMDSEVDADIKTLVLPADTTISALGAALVEDATTGDARTTLDAQQLIASLGEMTVAPASSDDFFYQDGAVAKKINWSQFQAPTLNDTNARVFGNGDVSQMLVYTGTGGHDWTMNSGVGQGKCFIGVMNFGSGDLTLVSGTATLATAGLGLVVPPNAIAVLCRIDTDDWLVGGTGLTA